MTFVALTELDGTVNLTEMHGRDCKIRSEMHGSAKLTEMHGAAKEDQKCMELPS